MRKFKSKFNGTLEVDIENGQKVLNSDNTCYSGKTLHDIFVKVFRKVDLDNSKSLLLLGLGGGTVVKLLQDQIGYPGKITSVELDPVIIRIAVKEFGMKQSKKLELICDDATSFVRTSRKKFDHIICDIFVDNRMPEAIASNVFWNDVAKRLNPGGTIIFNGFMELTKLKHIGAFLADMNYDVSYLPNVNGSNSFLLAVKPL